MLNLRERWPQWLFYATLCFGFIMLNISYIEQKKQSNLIFETQRIDALVRRHGVIVNKVSDIDDNSSMTSFISVPQTIQECKSGVLGLKLCSTVTTMISQELQQPSQIHDPALEQKLSEIKTQINTLSTSASTSQDDINRFKPSYEFIQNIMKPLVSIIVLLAGLFVILSQRYKLESQKWAFGCVGTVLGFWLN